ncbi:hypothetical protein [Actinoplanes regularis]|uniref:Uncharacterized protein n=1 Tax=Actinoplanes regularis TaxID=52697 RepID=A0A238XJF0_9ACTN|nr:hypothetical protein [Actinoplanes regularis]GIE90505.1 hypothetical protein Are01nite_69850 [Actinoplanes regularis]SNR58840.1 hypothetical protein SAMN06264365_103497 [Actinoplanes regularis]
MTCALTTSEPPATDTAPTTTLGQVIAAWIGGFPVVRLDAGTSDAVVISGGDAVTEVLLDDGVLSTEPLDRLATVITDPFRQATLLRQAARSLHNQTRAAKAALDRQQREHERQLQQIRDYAIARHRDGDICRDGLDRFLEHFGMPPYEPLVRVRFTVRGSYLVRGSTADAAKSDGSYLRLDTSNVDDVVEDSEEFHVDIDSADELADD